LILDASPRSAHKQLTNTSSSPTSSASFNAPHVHHKAPALSTLSAEAAILSQAAGQRDTLTSRAFLSFDKLRAQVEDLLEFIEQLPSGNLQGNDGDKQQQHQGSKDAPSQNASSKQVVPSSGWVTRLSAGGTATVHDLMREAAAALAAANRWQAQANEGMRAAQAAHQAAWAKV
jgi:hypothetical protein